LRRLKLPSASVASLDKQVIALPRSWRVYSLTTFTKNTPRPFRTNGGGNHDSPQILENYFVTA
jgi:hypothetical protein